MVRHFQVVDKFEKDFFVLLSDTERGEFEQNGIVRVLRLDAFKFFVVLINHEHAQEEELSGVFDNALSNFKFHSLLERCPQTVIDTDEFSL